MINEDVVGVLGVVKVIDFFVGVLDYWVVDVQGQFGIFYFGVNGVWIYDFDNDNVMVWLFVIGVVFIE